MLDNGFFFAKQQALTGTADVVSTNVHRAWDPGIGTNGPVILFDGVDNGYVAVQITGGLGGTNPTFRARFVGADNAALTSNPVILAETGVSAVLVAADIPKLYFLPIAMQRTAKEYYGVIFTQGGTTPTTTVNAFYTYTQQSNLIR